MISELRLVRFLYTKKLTALTVALLVQCCVCLLSVTLCTVAKRAS